MDSAPQPHVLRESASRAGRSFGGSWAFLEPLRRCYSLRTELVIVVVTLLVWQALRILFEGTRQEALAHAREWLAAERVLHVDIEARLIGFVYEHGRLHRAANLAYGNLHIAVVVGLLAAARLRAPNRYPMLRTTFVLAHAYALVVLAAYPLAPPRWLEGRPAVEALPPDLGDLRNETAAAVSLHFGYTLFVAGVALWLWPRSPLAWSGVLYPPLILAVVLGTGHHYVLDAVVGASCVALAASSSSLVHGPAAPLEPVAASARRTALIGLSAALAGLVANGLVTGGLAPPI